MEVSIILAKIFGTYLIVLTLAMLINPRGFRQNIRDLTASPGALTVAGVITLLLGIFLVVIHNNWVANWTVIITLIAWLTLLKGLMRFLIPSWTRHVTGWLSNNTAYFTVAMINLALGIALIYFGVILQ